MAFKLLYLILLGDFGDEVKDSNKVLNAVLFVVSHAGIFKWRTRTVVRAASEERFVVSENQRSRLDKWEKGEAAKEASERDGDATTSEEGNYDMYDTDFSD